MSQSSLATTSAAAPPGGGGALSRRRRFGAEALFRGTTTAAGTVVLVVIVAIATFLVIKAIPGLHRNAANFLTVSSFFLFRSIQAVLAIAHLPSAKGIPINLSNSSAS